MKKQKMIELSLGLSRCHRMSNLIGGYKKEGYKIRDLIGGGTKIGVQVGFWDFELGVQK